MGMPVAERDEPLCPHILHRFELLSRVESEMLLGVVDVGENVDLLNDLVPALKLTRDKTAGLYGGFFFCVCDYLFVVASSELYHSPTPSHSACS